jgi:hypothetical protein
MDNILSWSRAVLQATPARWTSLAQNLPAELLVRPPAPGEWPALACLLHLIDTEREVFPPRVRALLAGQDFVDFQPGGHAAELAGVPDIAGYAAEFARLRESGLGVLAAVTPDDLNRRGRHPKLGMVTLSELLHGWAAHDLNHTVQAERALMQPFILGCGPWQVYFKDHLVEVK